MRADRLLSIIMLLQTQGKMTAAALAEELEVSRRTILRDVNALSFAGVPIYTEGGHGGGISLDEAYRTTLTGLHEAEVRTLFIASNAQLLSDIGLGDAAESTLLKLNASLPVAHRLSVEHIRQRILIDPAWWWYDSSAPPFWEQLQQAVYEDRHIAVTYERYDGSVVSRLLEPYSLVAKSSLWYLVARRDGDFRTYRVSRLHALTLHDSHFQRDPAFDLTTYWQQHLETFAETISEYTFTLQIPAGQMNFVHWLTPGRCEVIDDSGAWVTARFHLESQALARMLVFGTQAVVLDPPELRDAVVEAARKIVGSAVGPA